MATALTKNHLVKSCGFPFSVDREVWEEDGKHLVPIRGVKTHEQGTKFLENTKQTGVVTSLKLN